jgi:arylsulfatase A-like enzyme
VKSTPSVPILFLLAGLTATLSAADRPNILLIAVDDLNHWVHHLGRNTQAITPNLDRLAHRGVSFLNAHTASSVCNPSRAALFTGLRPSTSGIYGNSTDWRTVIPDGYALPGWLRRNGYTTWGSGKLFHTARQIRESDWNHYEQNPRDESLHQQETSGAGSGSTADTRRYTLGNLSIAELAGGDDSVGDYWTASATIEALRAARESPFFIACGIFRPHLPWHVPQEYFELYQEEELELPPHLDNDLADVSAGINTREHEQILQQDGWRKAIRAYLASVTFADRQVGRILEALEASPHRDNTIVVVFGDHGWHLGEKQKWRKTGLWEEATRVPYVWAGPGIAKGERSGAAVDLMSLYPTLAALIGLPPPSHVEGSSIAPLLAEPNRQWHASPALTTWHFNNHAVRTDRWRYLRWNDGSEELYDHQNDPFEWHNLLHPMHATRADGLNLDQIKAELRAHFPAINRTTEEGRAALLALTLAPVTDDPRN